MIINFDAKQHEPKFEDNNEKLGPGDYVVTITESTRKTAKSGNDYIEFVVAEINGDGIQYIRLNKFHDNPTVVAIADRKLSAICYAVDVLTPVKTEDLHGKQFGIRVELQKNSDKFTDVTNVYKAESAAQAFKAPWDN